MAQNNSHNTANPPPKASGPEAGFGAGGKKPPVKGKKFPRGVLPALFAAAALGSGVMLANMDRANEPRTLTNQEFNGAAVISQDALFFGPDSREYQYYQSLVSEGHLAAGDSHIKLSRDLTTLYRVSPETVNGVDGVKYEDVTNRVQQANYNDDLIVSGFHHREFSAALSYFDDLNEDFDPEVGIVKLANKDDYAFGYHIYRNEQGYGEIRIISDSYQAAHAEDLELAAAQMASMGQAAHIWDHGAPWDAFFANVHLRCATTPTCQL